MFRFPSVLALMIAVAFGATLMQSAFRAPGAHETSAPSAAGQTQPNGVTFAVIPQFDPRKLGAIWTPVITELAARSGVRLSLVIPATMSEFQHGLAAGRYDFVYANPYQLLREADRQGYRPLVRDAEPLRGILVVRADSRVNSPAALDGKVLAVPSQNAVAASLLLRAELERGFQVRVKLLDAKTHGGAFLAVAGHDADAGGGADKTFRDLDPLIKGALKVIHTTGEIPPHAIAAHPRVPAHIAEAIRQAFLKLGTAPEGRAMLAKVQMRQPVPASMDEYRPLTDWHLERYWIDDTD